MNDKVQLKHPQGKKAITMNKEKYDLLKPAVLQCLRTKKNSTFAEIVKAIDKDFKTKKQKFEGSLSWHLEWVKLDLEANKVIKRVADSSPVEYIVV